MKKEAKFYRHGDLSFHPIKELPSDLKNIIHGGSFVLAEGEFTGHKHLMQVKTTPDDMKIMQDKEGNYYIQLDSEAKLSHEEHKTLYFEPGLYKMNVEREYDYFAEETKRERRVLD